MSSDEATNEPLVEQIEAKWAEIETNEDVGRHSQDGIGLRPDERVAVWDAHGGEQHETEEDGVHQRHSGQQSEEPRTGHDVHYDGGKTEQDGPARTYALSSDAEGRRTILRRNRFGRLESPAASAQAASEHWADDCQIEEKQRNPERGVHDG